MNLCSEQRQNLQVGSGVLFQELINKSASMGTLACRTGGERAVHVVKSHPEIQLTFLGPASLLIGQHA